MVVAGYTSAELYAVLSTLPTKPRLFPSVAWRLICENFEATDQIIWLTSAMLSRSLTSYSMPVLTGAFTTSP